MNPRLLILFFLALSSLGLWAQSNKPPVEDRVSLQFPNNSVSEVASFYELLTEKRLIRDSNLNGPNLSIVVPGTVTKAEAIGLIEAALLLNGYSLVPTDEKTAKLLGPSKQPRSESVPLYVESSQLPENDQVVSYFMSLRYVKNAEAAAIFSSYVTLHPYGSMVPVANVNALVITENVPLIRRLIALKQVFDVEGSKMETEFFILQRADAERVADMLKELLDTKELGPNGAIQPANPESAQNGANVTAGAALSAPQQKVQIIPDVRTNRVMVVASEQQMPYIRRLVESLDVAVSFEEPLERPLRFVKAGEVLPVLANLLMEGSDNPSATATGGNGPSGGTQNITESSTSYAEASSEYGGGGGVGSKPDKLRAPSESTAPLSLIVGKARIIADRSSNKIIVIGPPESRSKASRVLDMLDRRPKQIYLATVIGQLTLGKGVEAGVDYLVRFGNLQAVGPGESGNLGTLVNRAAGLDLLPGATEAVQSVASTATTLAGAAIPALSGLTVFGTIGDSVDVYARALASTNRFKIISRPVIYTANNKKAVISSGQQVPIPENTLTSAVNGNGNQNQLGAAVASTIEYKDVVLKLEVIPLINSNNEVTLTIAQQNDNIQEQVEISNNQVPVIGTQELTTTVTVPNRQTIILGGLITDQEQRLQTGIPFLKDIPGLGYFFSTTKKNVTRRELIVMIQPFIIDSDEDLAEANAQERAKTGFKDQAFEDSINLKNSRANDPKTDEVIPNWSIEKANGWVNDPKN